MASEHIPGHDSLSIETSNMASVTPIHENLHPQQYEGVSLLRGFQDIGANALNGCVEKVEKVKSFGHELVHGRYSDKFRSEFKSRIPYETSDGVKLTARVLNPEFLNNDEHAVVYSYSLLVPAAHGAELPTVADIATQGEKTGRAVIAITTDGLAGSMNFEQLRGLAKFWNMPKRRFEVLRHLLPKDKRLIVTGASLGGMMSHALAATWEEEADESSHSLEVTHDIAIASAGHHKYSVKDYPSLAKQFAVQESGAGIDYVRQGENIREKVQRSFELAGTIPKHPMQLAAVAFISLGIMDAPLEGIEFRIPHSTKVIDATFDKDGVTHPRRRGQTWIESGHPDISHYDELGPHLELLTRGREITLEEIGKIPSKHALRLQTGV